MFSSPWDHSSERVRAILRSIQSFTRARLIHTITQDAGVQSRVEKARSRRLRPQNALDFLVNCDQVRLPLSRHQLWLNTKHGPWICLITSQSRRRSKPPSLLQDVRHARTPSRRLPRFASTYVGLPFGFLRDHL